MNLDFRTFEIEFQLMAKIAYWKSERKILFRAISFYFLPLFYALFRLRDGIFGVYVTFSCLLIIQFFLRLSCAL